MSIMLSAHILFVVVIFLLSIAAILFNVSILLSNSNNDTIEESTNLLDDSPSSIKFTSIGQKLYWLYFIFSIAFLVHPLFMFLTREERLRVSELPVVFLVVIINIVLGIILFRDALKIKEGFSKKIKNGDSDLNQTEEYFEQFNVLREKLIGRRIKQLKCCMIELEEPESFQYKNIQGCEFGFDLTLDTGETIYLRIDQIGHTFGLTCGFETILNSLLKGPKLWDLTENDFVSPILNKPIKNIEYSILRNHLTNDYRLDFIDKVEFILEDERFIILAAEYLPEKDDFYLEADEATLIVGNESAKKYKKKINI